MRVAFATGRVVQSAGAVPVDTQAADFNPIRFSTDHLPARHRISFWRDFFGPSVFRTEIEPASDTRFHADVTLRPLPGICMVSQAMSPVSLSRTPALLADGNDDVGFFVSTSVCTASQRGREMTLAPGEAALMSATEVGNFSSPSAARYRCLHVRRAELAPLVTDIDDAVLLRRIMPDSEALQYLLAYAEFLERRPTVDPDLARIAAVHLRDLFALVLGATHDAAVLAEGRGLRAARLQAMKRYVADNLNRGGLTVGSVAARHHVTPRYVQLLFESEGTTFSKFLLNQRLARVHRMLSDPRYVGWTVSAIALEAGFGDVSYFNRCFRRRFGAAPSEIRDGSGRAMVLGHATDKPD
jgi:AraC-like DNA-binding protein